MLLKMWNRSLTLLSCSFPYFFLRRLLLHYFFYHKITASHHEYITALTSHSTFLENRAAHCAVVSLNIVSCIGDLS